jgi:hypothetical protein
VLRVFHGLSISVRVKARKSSACGLCKSWKQGWADKKTARDIRHAQRAEQEVREGEF